MGNLRALLLSGYDAVSHRHWHNLLCKNLHSIDWTVISLPDRHFYWRARGNGLTYAFSHDQQLAGPFDLLIATSMVDLCTLRGFMPHLALVPTLVYFHENQFVYPMKPAGGRNSNIINAQLTSIYSALCADHILFNSQFNKDTFYQGAAALLNKMPDGVQRDLLVRPQKLSAVLAVPITKDNCIKELTIPAGFSSDDGPVEIVWNHRWEYDKQPEVFFSVMEKLHNAGIDFRLHVMGQSFREIPDCFAKARLLLQNKIVTWGHQSSADYYRILRQAHIVVSTALHDFQGLSLLEAIHRGCLPIAPDRVAYPEYIPPDLLYGIQQDEADSLFEKLVTLLGSPLPVAPDVTRYLEGTLIPDYQRLFERLANRQDDY